MDKRMPATRATESNEPFGVYRPAFMILLGAVIVELVAAALVGWHFLGLDPVSIYRVHDLTIAVAMWFIIPLAWLGLIAVSLARRKADHPTRTILRTVRRDRTWLVRGFVLTVIHIPLGKAFATFKSSIPHVQPFVWDQTFAGIDNSLFGLDAWQLTHAVTGYSGTVVIDRIYALWGTYLLLLASWISFTRNRELQIKAALAFHMCWLILGTVLATLLASAGPCFYELFHESERFAPLMQKLAAVDEEQSLLAFRAMQFLTENYGQAKLGVGISAMPSLHVAMATLGVILAYAANAPIWLKLAAIAFAATIMFGSVHLGWHYAVDGLVSIPLTYAVWVGCSKLVDAIRNDKPEEREMQEIWATS